MDAEGGLMSGDMHGQSVEPHSSLCLPALLYATTIQSPLPRSLNVARSFCPICSIMGGQHSHSSFTPSLAPLGLNAAPQQLPQTRVSAVSLSLVTTSCGKSWRLWLKCL